MDVAVAFGKVIHELRIAAGLTQGQHGFEADLRRTFVSLLELGQQQPILMTIFKIVESLCSTPSEIIKRVEALVSTAEAPFSRHGAPALIRQTKLMTKRSNWHPIQQLLGCIVV